MRRAVILAAVVAVVAAACGDDAEDTTTTTAPATTTAEATTVHLYVVDSRHGPIIGDAEGFSLYLFTEDEQGGPSTCIGVCTSLWPPLIGDAVATEGVDADLIGSVERDDGSLQVTYNGWPLYYYSPDTEPGNTRGQGTAGVWWLMSPDGEAVQ